jgi:hypothetical protein
LSRDDSNFFVATIDRDRSIDAGLKTLSVADALLRSRFVTSPASRVCRQRRAHMTRSDFTISLMTRPLTSYRSRVLIRSPTDEIIATADLKRRSAVRALASSTLLYHIRGSLERSLPRVSVIRKGC